MFEYVKIDDKEILVTETKDIINALLFDHYEVAETLEKEINQSYTEKQLQDKKLNSDLNSYETSLEDDRNTFSDIIDELKAIEELISNKRTNKELVLKSISQIKKVISNVY